MEELLTWAERLEKLAKGQVIELDEDTSDQSIYSAIRDHFSDKKKTFSIRTPKGQTKRFLIRIQ